MTTITFKDGTTAQMPVDKAEALTRVLDLLNDDDNDLFICHSNNQHTLEELFESVKKLESDKESER